MKYIVLKHSIYSKDPNGRILAEILFPEHSPGEYCIESTHVVDEYLGTQVPGELVEMAVSVIRKAGGHITATCPYAYKYLKERHMI